jgi:hypothetical protein
MCKKFHICRECYERIVKEFGLEKGVER